MTAIDRPVPFRHRLTSRQGRLAGVSALVIAIIAGVVIGAVVLTRNDVATPIAQTQIRPGAVQPASVAPPTVAGPKVAYIVRSQAEADELAARLAAADSTTGAFNGVPTANDIYVAGTSEEAQNLVQQLYADANMIGLPLMVVDLRSN